MLSRSLEFQQSYGSRPTRWIPTAGQQGLGRRLAGRPKAVAPGAALTADLPHIQLATARLPSDADEAAFQTALYQHAATLTQNGANLPFILPLKVDRLGDGGYQIGLLRRGDGGLFGSAVDIISSVEAVEGVGRVLFMRMFEGPFAFVGRQYAGPEEDRLEAVLQSHPDVAAIMGTMPSAIRRAAALSRPSPA